MASKDIAIKSLNISKRYRIGLKKEMHDSLTVAALEFIKSPLRNYHKYRSLYNFDDSQDKDGDSSRNDPYDIIWALRDVSFVIKKGEAVGIIGRNGAGKSTLLKVLCGITDPTRGVAEIRGRVSSLLEIGTGFHPELTGRENIYLNGTILGMTKREVDSWFDEIVEFSGVERFIDTPLKRYSSGMKVRLAFSVAAHLDSEILLVDEVLAVGDTAFQRKCLGKMQDVVSRGRTVLFVTHNLPTVEALCQRGLVLSEGRLVADTSATDAVRSYISNLSDESLQPLAVRKDREGNGKLKFANFWMENSAQDRINLAVAGDDTRFCFEYRTIEGLRDVHVLFTLRDENYRTVISCTTSCDERGDPRSIPEKGVFVCEIPRFPLRAGSYQGDVVSKVNGILADYVRNAFRVEVVDGDYYGTGKLPQGAKVLIPHTWKVRTTGGIEI